MTTFKTVTEHAASLRATVEGNRAQHGWNVAGFTLAGRTAGVSDKDSQAPYAGIPGFSQSAMSAMTLTVFALCQAMDIPVAERQGRGRPQSSERVEAVAKVAIDRALESGVSVRDLVRDLLDHPGDMGISEDLAAALGDPAQIVAQADDERKGDDEDQDGGRQDVFEVLVSFSSQDEVDAFLASCEHPARQRKVSRKA